MGIHLLQLRFTVLAPIRRLPHYHGPQWSALFRHLLRECGDTNGAGGGSPVWVQPIETGIADYEPGEVISLGLTVADRASAVVARLLSRFNMLSGSGTGHFQPGVTIALESAFSRRTGLPWDSLDTPLCPVDIAPEIEQLQKLDRFTLVTLSPLRIPRPAGSKCHGHEYCDADFLLGEDGSQQLAALLSKIDSAHAAQPPPQAAITGGALNWHDIAYGSGNQRTTFGGTVGALEVDGRLLQQEAETLVRGQYLGLGKNRAFGLGFYTIPELDIVRRVAPLSRATTLLARSILQHNLGAALAELPDSAPGPDQMTVADARAGGEALLETLRESMLNPQQGPAVDLLRHDLPKPQGGHRSIYLQNVRERILHKAFANFLTPSLDGLPSQSAYAYRRGFSRHNAAATLRQLLAEGYVHGIKADIADFFDAVKTTELGHLLKGLYPAEPLIDYLNSWLIAARQQGVPGLPQGWILSPPLSNLYLERFDRQMEHQGFRLVRFADDFVILVRGGENPEACRQSAEQGLKRLGLALNPEKTSRIEGNQPISFLGFLVSGSGISDNEPEDRQRDEGWDTIFRSEWRQGLPVYLTSICQGAYSSGPHLVMNQEREEQESIPWSRVSRLVIVGRSSFSGGVIYRAVREQVPVSFIDVMGRVTGNLNTPGPDETPLAKVQLQKKKDAVWIQEIAGQLIAAKINNSKVLLRRNGLDVAHLRDLEEAALNADTLDSLRCIEKAAARVYFDHFATLVAPFDFHGRCYHPPDSPVNVLLSFGYTLLYNRLSAALKDKGFNPHLGLLRADRGRHAALTSNIMEPLRHIIDRIVLALIHLREITPANFVHDDQDETGPCRMDGEGFRIFINRYERTMATMFTPKKGVRMSYNLWLDETADDLRRSMCFDFPYAPLWIS